MASLIAYEPDRATKPRRRTDSGEVICGVLVVSGCHASSVLEPAPEALDPVVLRVGFVLVGDECGSRGGGRDDGDGLPLRQKAAPVVGVVSAIRDQATDCPGRSTRVRATMLPMVSWVWVRCCRSV